MSFTPLFATVIQDVTRNKTVYVESINAFPDPVGDTITLETDTTYIWTKPVNTGTYKFAVPTDSNITLKTTNTVANNWITEITGSDVLLSGDIARLRIDELDITSNNGGVCFNLSVGADLQPNLFMTELRITGFDSLGTLTGCSFFIENIAFSGNGDGLTLVSPPVITSDEVNFVSHTGDGFIISGTVFLAVFGSIVSTPASGDSLFNIDASTNIILNMQFRNGQFNNSSRS